MEISYCPKFLILKAIIRRPKSMNTDKRDWLSKEGTNSRGGFFPAMALHICQHAQ